jgi:hypothetical protein
LKKDNLSSLLPQAADEVDPSLHGLERALSQLDMVNSMHFFHSNKQTKCTLLLFELVFEFEFDSVILD